MFYRNLIFKTRLLLAKVDRGVCYTCFLKGAKDNKRTKNILYLPKNMSNYALLGASYTSAPTDNLNVLIEVNADDGPVVEDHIAFRNDIIRSGIPAFYAKKIKDFFLEKSEDKILGGGELRINIGAHAEIGSSGAIFKVVCQILTELCETAELSEERIAYIFQNTLKINTSFAVDIGI